VRHVQNSKWRPIEKIFRKSIANMAHRSLLSHTRIHRLSHLLLTSSLILHISAWSPHILARALSLRHPVLSMSTTSSPPTEHGQADEHATKIRILGVGGGIGSGKSTACKILAEDLGCIAYIGTLFISFYSGCYDADPRSNVSHKLQCL
jgi:hypothetical protein